MKNTILKNVNVFDGKPESAILNNVDILIENGLIKKIGKNIEDKYAKVVDLSGKYVIPGLINLHSHIPGSGRITKKQVAKRTGLVSFVVNTHLGRAAGLKICEAHAKQNLYSGVTTVRLVGGIDNFDAILRDKINSGKAIGPRLIVANYAVGPVHSHMEGTVSVSAKTNEEAVAYVEKQIAKGADFIKLMITGGILDTKEKGHIGILKMPADMVKACCDYAHSKGLKVAAHVEGEEGMIVAIENGVDTIEHGSYADEEHLKMFHDRGGVIVLTLSPAIPLVKLSPGVTGYSEEVKYNSQVFMDKMVENALTCLKMGIPVGLGNDAGCPLVPHYDFWREPVYFHEYVPGITNEFAIYSATLGNAKILGLDQTIGSVEEGKEADMVVYDANPLDDLGVLKDPYVTIKHGRIYTKKASKYSSVEKRMSLLDC